jgi:hypothetical protein
MYKFTLSLVISFTDHSFTNKRASLMHKLLDFLGR